MNKVRSLVKWFLPFCLIALLPLTAAAASKPFTLVIDAGHGGHDTGAVGAISKEKNLTLEGKDRQTHALKSSAAFPGTHLEFP